MSAFAPSKKFELILAGLCLLIGLTVWGLTWNWPLMNDAQLFHYLAWRFLNGDAPYRDVMDMNFPGIYLVHMGVLSFLGDSDLAWRAFDGMVALLGGLLAFMIVRPHGLAGALVATTLVLMCSILPGPGFIGQRDFMIAVAVLGIIWLLMRPPSAFRYFMCGVLLGLATTLKPTAILFSLLVLWPPAGTTLHLWVKGLWRVILPAALGGALPLLAVFGWVTASGGLPTFLDEFFNYALPIYSQTGADSRSILPALLRSLDVFGALVSVGLIAFFMRPANNYALWYCRLFFLLGAISLLIQGKFWFYHFFPIALAACLLMSIALVENSIRLVRVTIYIVLLVFLIGSGFRSVTLGGAIADQTSSLLKQINQDLAPYSGQRVQLLDIVVGSLNEARVNKLQPASRHFYPFPFFAATSVPGAASEALQTRWRDELLSSLRARPPVAIFMTRRSWPEELDGYDRWQKWPDFLNYLDEKYTLAKQHEEDDSRTGYRIYRLKTLPAP